MTRMIERWFPCQEVSDNSSSGWGSGNSERGLFTWFAARPTAQAKAAVLTSLLPWPEDESEQKRLRELVQDAMSSRDAARDDLIREIQKWNPPGITVVDPFSGRGMIPFEAARLGFETVALDYSPVATLASELLLDHPFRDWSAEPLLIYADAADVFSNGPERLTRDIESVLREIGRRHQAALKAFFPEVNARVPWGYIWATTLPCQDCGRRFPLVGSYELRRESRRRGKKGGADVADPGQSFYISVDRQTDEFNAVVHDGPPTLPPTLANATGRDGRKVRGKSAICPFCDNVHPLALHQRLSLEGLGQDVLLVVADLDDFVGKRFREPTTEERAAARSASSALENEAPFADFLPAVPDEQIPEQDGATIRPQLYGAKTYGDLMCDRQTLDFVRLTRIIAEIAHELVADIGISPLYARALSGYAGANVVRKLKYSTRGSPLQIMPNGGNKVVMCMQAEGSVAFSYDFFEAGIGDGPGTWTSMVDGYMSTLRKLFANLSGLSAKIERGSAITLPLHSQTAAAVVTDPPYDSMVYYSDSSDVFFVWLKRALHSTHPELSFTADPRGVQEKSEEIIVKEHGRAPDDPRTREHYDSLIARAFAEARRVVRLDGIVTIVFGHGEPEVWHRLLKAIVTIHVPSSP